MTATVPAVSLCMVTHGALHWVQRSIEAITSHTTAPYELVMVDNASNDGTREWLRDHVDATFVELDHNTGFAAGYNLAANLARAPVLCIVNSDVIVSPGWLEPLLEPLADPSIAITVPLFVNVDGSLQEAGSNVEPDGRVEAFGLDRSPDESEWTWPRRVTYGSAACWAIRTATFRSLGGFDCGYGRAYYEDVDFAFSARARGLRVELVPAVRVVHAQGASSTSREAAVQMRDANQARFARRNAVWLAHHSHIHDLPNEPHRYPAARDADVPLRYAIIADSLERVESALAKTAADAARVVMLDNCRLTAEARGSLEARGVELVDDASRVLRERLMYFSHVMAADAWIAPHKELVATAQPQAEVIEF